MSRRPRSKPAPDSVTGDAPASSRSTRARADDLKRLDALVRLLDEAFRIPGTKYRIGLDGLLGFVPGLGDLIGAALASYVLKEAARLGASKTTLARMAGNIALDMALGAVPLVGDLFDVAFKANRRNYKLLCKHLDRQVSPTPRNGSQPPASGHDGSI